MMHYKFLIEGSHVLVGRLVTQGTHGTVARPPSISLELLAASYSEKIGVMSHRRL